MSNKGSNINDKYHPYFAIVKSDISAAICQAIAETNGHIDQEHLNVIANTWADSFIEYVVKKERK